MDPVLAAAIASIPAGRYAVAVSGGADSVALLHLLHHHRPELHLHVVHLDHQTRGPDSTADAHFVGQLAASWNLNCTIARRDQIEPLLGRRPTNKSAFFRALRHALFHQAMIEHKLDAVLLAHHADDQAETVLHRLLRGSTASGLAAMKRSKDLSSLLLLRPLLDVHRRVLRDYLREVRQPWREDASNASSAYLRNRLRRVLVAHPPLTGALRDLGNSAGELTSWVRQTAPSLGRTFPIAQLNTQPPILAEESARRWLIQRGAPPVQISPRHIEQLLTMAADAASPPRQHFPGGLLVRRRSRQISVEPA